MAKLAFLKTNIPLHMPYNRVLQQNTLTDSVSFFFLFLILLDELSKTQRYFQAVARRSQILMSIDIFSLNSIKFNFPI